MQARACVHASTFERPQVAFRCSHSSTAYEFKHVPVPTRKCFGYYRCYKGKISSSRRSDCTAEGTPTQGSVEPSYDEVGLPLPPLHCLPATMSVTQLYAPHAKDARPQTPKQLSSFAQYVHHIYARPHSSQVLPGENYSNLFFPGDISPSRHCCTTVPTVSRALY